MYNATGLAGEMASRIGADRTRIREPRVQSGAGRGAADETEHGWQEPSATPSSWYRRGGRGFRRRMRDIVNLESGIREVGETPRAIFLECAPQQAANRGWRRRRQGREVRGALQHAGEHVTGVVTVECRTPRQHLVQHAAERPDVRPLVHGLAARLLRAHVRGSPQDDALRVASEVTVGEFASDEFRFGSDG